MEKKKMGLPMQIFLALILGIVVGLVLYFAGAAEFTTSYLKPFGDIFVNLLKFIVVPVVLFSMIDGIISMGDMKKVGSVGWKTVAYFMVTTAIACGDRADLLGTSCIIRGFSAQAVQIGPTVSQSVDLRLQRLLLHGQLLHTVDAVFVKIKELLLVAVKLNGLCP